MRGAETTPCNSPARVEAASLEDLPEMVQLLMELFETEGDFEPDCEKQEQGLRLILEQPSRGRILALRGETTLIGMANLLFTISTAEGGLVVILEDLVIHPAHRRQGYGTQLLKAVIEFAKQKGFKRITLLTDKMSEESQRFFAQHNFGVSAMIPMRLRL